MDSTHNLPNQGENDPVGVESDLSKVSNPSRAEDRRLMYYEHQVQRSECYRGPLDEIPIEKLRVTFQELLDYSGVCYWEETPLPPAGLPGRLHTKYDWNEPAGELLLIGIGYIEAIIRNERRSMHNRWEEARHFISKLQTKEEERVVADVARNWSFDRDQRDARPQLVYFIGAGSSGPIKIGIAGNPKSRLQGLQTSHHERLELLATCEGGAEQERAYHNLFADHRLNGEWFERCPEIEAEIARLVP